MVSILLGLPGILAVIEQRILACVPTTFATDTFVKADRAQREGQNNLLIDYWRQFGVEVSDSDPSAFQGNYAYQNRTLQLNVLLWYSRAGAARVTGNPDVDFQALAFQDAHDIQRALQGPITTADGSTARVIYQNVNVSQDDVEAEVAISFALPCFLRGTAQVPALYLGPSQQHALDGGSTFYLVAQSDLACSGVLASSPAGCSHDTALDLGSGTPQVIEVTCSTAGTYTFTLTGAGGTSTCTVVVFAAEYPLDFNLPVFSKNPGLVELTYPEGITGPATVNIEGARVWRNASILKSNAFFAPAEASAIMKNRQGITIGLELNLTQLFNDRVLYSTTMSGMKYLVGNYAPPVSSRQHSWEFISTFYQGSLLFDLYANQANDGISVIQGYLRRTIATTDICEFYRICLVFPSITGALLCREKLDGYSINALPIGFSVGGFSGSIPLTCQTLIKDVARFFYANSELSSDQQDLFLNGGMPSDPCVVQYAINEEGVSKAYDLSGNNYDGVLNLDAGRETIGPSRIYTDSQTVVPWATVPCVATESGTKTINGRRRRPGVPDRASEGEKWQLATATVVNGKVTVPMVFMD